MIDEIDEAYMHLIEAVVIRAAADYLEARELADNGNEYEGKKAARLERWFVSKWGNALCYGNGAYILERLQKEKCNFLRPKKKGGKK